MEENTTIVFQGFLNLPNLKNMISKGKLFVRILVYSLFIIVCGSSVFSQEKSDELKPKIEYQESTCYLNSTSLQGLDALYEAKDLIIIVSHSGKSEKKEMADRRLYNARTFLVKISTKKRAQERIIITKGEESAGEGYLDFFVKGDLYYRIYFPKNREFLVQPCVQNSEMKPCSEEDANLYYPCKK